MLHTTENVIRHKIGLLNLAEELDKVSEACKIMGVSRDTFYRLELSFPSFPMLRNLLALEGTSAGRHRICSHDVAHGHRHSVRYNIAIYCSIPNVDRIRKLAMYCKRCTRIFSKTVYTYIGSLL